MDHRSHNGRIKTKIVIFLAVVFIAVLAFLIVQQQKRLKEHEAHMQIIWEKVEPLEQKKKDYMNQMDQLEAQYEDVMRGLATEQIVFRELDEKLYTEVYPMMEEHFLEGVMVLSEDEFPGKEGKITMKQFKEMLSNEWTYCVLYDGEEDFRDWNMKMLTLLEQNDLVKPETVFFQKGAYDKSMDSQLVSADYQIAVHHGETSYPILITEYTKKLWHPGVWYWNYDGVLSDIQTSVDERGNISYSVSFTKGQPDYYEKEFFANMLDYVKKFEDTNQLIITGYMDAYERKKLTTLGQEDAQKELDYRKKKLQQEIDNLNAEIDVIYNQYNEEYPVFASYYVGSE